MLTVRRVDEAAPSRALDPAEELVRRHLPLVEHIVNRVAARFPRGVDRDELVQVAMVGLVEAARRFDDSRGVAFSTYAGRRIEGAILDALRASCWAPRSVRSNQRLIDAAESRLQGRLRRRATEEELAAELGVSPRLLAAWRDSVARSAVLSLDAERPGPGGAGRFGETIADPQPSPEDLVETRAMRDRVRSCLSLLPDRHRYVVVGHLLEDRPMHELADHLGVTRSRASQLKAEAIQLLRIAVEGPADSPAPAHRDATARPAQSAERAPCSNTRTVA
jgi:RNA polymerase sigma factor for flagellar operon FliA